MAIGYALLTGAVWAYEAHRIRTSGPDMITVFIVLFVLQCCLPGVVIFACLPFVDPLSPTGILPFDKMFSRLDLPVALLVLSLTTWFVLLFYFFTALMRKFFCRFGARLSGRSRYVVSGAPGRLVGVLIVGLALTTVSFWLIGDSLVARYANLILLRQYSEDVERTLLNAYAFSLTQSWSWLSVPALFVISEMRGRKALWYLCLGCAIVFAVLSVSRRAIFIPILLAYLTMVLSDGRWRIRWLLAAAIPVLVWVGFGKEIFSAIASGASVENVTDRYATFPSALIRTASDIGLTIMESVGTISLLDLDLRFGVDHLLSFLRRIPVSWFGWEPDLPVRIVRLSTEEFATADAQDIPPGLFGQMWLDFGVFGPIFWAFLFAFQMSILQRLFASTIVTKQAIAVFAVLTFVIALPLNTGSYDFTFSVDIFVLLLAVLFTFRRVRVRVPDYKPGATTSAARGPPPGPAPL